MNISLPESLMHFIEEEVLEGGYSSTSVYMRDLVRQHWRSKAEARLQALIAEGLASGSVGQVTPDTFAQMRKELREQYGKAR